MGIFKYFLIKGQRRELRKFLKNLRQMTMEQKAHLKLSAALFKDLQKANGLDLSAPFLLVKEKKDAALQVALALIHLQNHHHKSLILGGYVWLHTLHAVQDEDFTMEAGEMWSLLSEADELLPPLAKKILPSYQQATNRTLTDEELLKIPEGFSF